MTIDMKSYAGENLDSPAPVDQNSYQQEMQDSPLGIAQDQEQAPPASMAEAQPVDEKFASFREEVDRIKAEREEERRTIQLQLDMLRANQAQPARQEQAPRKFLDGMGDTDIPNVGEIRREWEARESAYQSKISELEFAQYHPDYAETLDKHLAPLVKNKPILAEVIRHSPNPAQAAYEIGQLAKGAIPNTPHPTQKSMNAQRIVDNARKPGTLSQTGGQGALSKADYYASMSDQEFAKFASQHFD